MTPLLASVVSLCYQRPPLVNKLKLSEHAHAHLKDIVMQLPSYMKITSYIKIIISIKIRHSHPTRTYNNNNLTLMDEVNTSIPALCLVIILKIINKIMHKV